MRPVEIVRKIAPKARASYLSAFENGDALFAKHGITTPIRLAHFLAQVLHECGGLTIEWESGAYSAKRLLEIFGEGHHSAKVTPAEATKLAMNGPAIFERVYGLGNPTMAKALGNLNPGDGFRYRGCGIMQTTGRANYRRMGQRCGVDFEGHPELVLSAEHALKPALAEWTEGNLNVLADKSDIRGITRRINGGYNGLAEREIWFQKVRPLCEGMTLAVSGATIEPPAPTPPPPVPVNTPAVTPKASQEGTGAAAGATGSGLAAQQAGLSVGWIIAFVVIGAVVGAIGVAIYKNRKG